MANAYDKFIPANQKIESTRSNRVYDKFKPSSHVEVDDVGGGGGGGGGGSGVDIEHDGASVLTGATTLDFRGAGLAVSDQGSGRVRLTISAEGAAIAVDVDGTELTATLARMNFVGDGVVITDNGEGEIEFEIPGAGAAGLGDRIFATLAEAAAALVPITVPRVIVLRWDSTSEYCPTEYVYRANDPGHDLKFPAASGFFVIASDYVNMWSAGLKRAGTTVENQAAIGRVRTWLLGRDYATVYTPSGEYLCGTNGTTYIWILDNYPTKYTSVKLTMLGDGPKRSIYKCGDGMNCGFMTLGNSDGFELHGIGFNGNRANNTLEGVHGIRMERYDNVWIDNFDFYELRGYGIGFQGDFGDLGMTNVRITNGRIYHPNSDGIDIKNRDGMNESVYIENVTVYSPGASSIDRAFDLRGPILVNNCRAVIDKDGCVGFQIREQAESGQTGGKYTVLSNFQVDCMGTAGVGVAIGDHYSQVSNGSVYNVHANGQVIVWGFETADRCNISNISVHLSQDTGGYCFWIGGDYMNVVGCSATGVNGGAVGFKTTGIRNNFIGCIAQQQTVLFESAGSTNFLGCGAYDGTVSTTQQSDVVVGCRGAGTGTHWKSLIMAPLGFIPEYANASAALTGGLQQGGLFRTGGTPQFVS